MTVELPAVSQIGILVNNAEKTAEYYTLTFGIGPFTILDIDMPEGSMLRGKPATGKLRIAIAKMGPVDIELIQVLEGAEYYAEILRHKGEGLHHLGMRINDSDAYENLLAELANREIEPSFRVDSPGVSCAYLETMGGLTIEPIYIGKRK